MMATMQQQHLHVLILSAVSIGFLHTLIGIDHTLPFVVLGRAQKWSYRKTATITALCGFGHVASSVVLGVLGIGLGVAIGHLTWVENARGTFAAWFLIVFGLGYTGWSLARSRRGHRHVHVHADGLVHSHDDEASAHQPDGSLSPAALTAWSLFIIFVLGPCEPLIPLLMVPAFDLGAWAAVPVTLAFGATTIGTMMVLVTAGFYGLGLPTFKRLEGHANTLAGVAIALSGVVIMLFGI
jgi:sulfite exporter TauE/SafE